MTQAKDKPTLPGETPPSPPGDGGITRRAFIRGTAVGAVGAFVVSGAVAAIAWPKEEVGPGAPAPSPGTAPAPAPGAAPAKAPLGFINVDYEKCVGCRICEAECAIFHEGVPDLKKSRIRVHYFNPPVDIASVCQQCSDSPCVASCPDKVAALVKNKDTGVVEILTDKCTGCGLCVEACAKRSGSIRLDEEKQVVYGICDLCGGQTMCVKYCPSGALSVGVTGVDGRFIARPPAEIAKRVAAHMYRA